MPKLLDAVRRAARHTNSFSRRVSGNLALPNPRRSKWRAIKCEQIVAVKVYQVGEVDHPH
jgi:hypothetical protein